ncbi:hypothetical protein L211DRAFT_543933 [Terfezia boudieri ATCC MYA-4762]|uniref:Uncharacterized protein n=1 Tax=Terfezia boudieri ATCC MYA-4762 TaxID=1051890 RepID=A0A3N4LX06_9PEZI|nr:hypothetical protein L211DRAFT_543933 [Terfezia boudieri ATCC MYA-4762]
MSVRGKEDDANRVDGIPVCNKACEGGGGGATSPWWLSGWAGGGVRSLGGLSCVVVVIAAAAERACMRRTMETKGVWRRTCGGACGDRACHWLDRLDGLEFYGSGLSPSLPTTSRPHITAGLRSPLLCNATAIAVNVAAAAAAALLLCCSAALLLMLSPSYYPGRLQTLKLQYSTRLTASTESAKKAAIWLARGEKHHRAGLHNGATRQRSPSAVEGAKPPRKKLQSPLPPPLSPANKCNIFLQSPALSILIRSKNVLTATILIMTPAGLGQAKQPGICTAALTATPPSPEPPLRPNQESTTSILSFRFIFRATAILPLTFL